MPPGLLRRCRPWRSTPWPQSTLPDSIHFRSPDGQQQRRSSSHDASADSQRQLKVELTWADETVMPSFANSAITSLGRTFLPSVLATSRIRWALLTWPAPLLVAAADFFAHCSWLRQPSYHEPFGLKPALFNVLLTRECETVTPCSFRAAMMSLGRTDLPIFLAV